MKSFSSLPSAITMNKSMSLEFMSQRRLSEMREQKTFESKSPILFDLLSVSLSTFTLSGLHCALHLQIYCLFYNLYQSVMCLRHAFGQQLKNLRICHVLQI